MKTPDERGHPGLRYRITGIDSPGKTPERLAIRGFDLNELVGRIGVVEMFDLVVYGSSPSSGRKQLLDALLLQAFSAVNASHPAWQIAAKVGSFSSPLHALIAGTACGLDDVVKACVPAGDALGLSQEQTEAAVYFGALPALIGAAVQGGQVKPDKHSPSNFVEGVRSHLVHNQDTPVPAEMFNAFEAVLVSVQAGFGAFLPIVGMPRQAATFKTSLNHCIVIGLSVCGRPTATACDDLMQLLDEVRPGGTGTVDNNKLIAAIEKLINIHGEVPGFGHILFERDPRVTRLKAYLSDLRIHAETLHVFDQLCGVAKHHSGFNPYVDAFAAAVFHAAGIQKNAGSALLLWMRSAAIIAHVLEARQEPTPTRTDVRRFLTKMIEKVGQP